MKICHLTSVHQWNDNRIFHKQCVSLARHGFEVHLVAINSTAGVHKGVHVHEVKIESGSRVARILSGRKKVYHKALEIDADIYQIHDPELLTFALKLKKQHKKVIYDSHEDVAKQILYKSWLGPVFFRKFISFIYDTYEKSTVKKLDGLISVIDEITNNFECPHSITIKNFPLTEAIIKAKDKLTGKEKWITYVGGLTRERGIKDYILAMKSVPEPYKLLLIGKFSDQHFFEECKQLKEWGRVDYVGFQPIDKVNELLVKSYIGLSVLHPEQNYLTSLPTKGFEYMAAGIPMIMSNFDYWKPYFEKCAILVEPANPEIIGQAINLLIENEDLYESKKQHCEEEIKHYTWEGEEKKLIRFYQKIGTN